MVLHLLITHFLLEAPRVVQPDSIRTQDNWPCQCRMATQERQLVNGLKVSVGVSSLSIGIGTNLCPSLLLDDYQRGTSSSVSPRGGYCSSASTPHSSNGGGSYSNANSANPNSQNSAVVNGYSNMGGIPSSPASVFNSTSSKYIRSVLNQSFRL